MDLSWRDTWTTLLTFAGATEVFAKWQGYTWWLVGTWDHALATLGVIGLLMLLLNVAELTDWRNWVNWSEAILWIGTAALIVTGFFVAAQGMFYSAAIVLGVVWIGLLTRHSLHTTHHHPSYVGSR